MRFFLHISGILFALFSAAFSAAPAHAGEDQIIGLVTGATFGSIVGNQFGHGGGRVLTTATGALAGGWIGNDIGQSMDNSRLHRDAMQSANAYSLASTPSYRAANYAPNYVAPDAPDPQSIYDEDYGRYCRPYSESVRVGNHIQENYGTVCLQPDGTWRVVE